MNELWRETKYKSSKRLDRVPKIPTRVVVIVVAKNKQVTLNLDEGADHLMKIKLYRTFLQTIAKSPIMRP